MMDKALKFRLDELDEEDAPIALELALLMGASADCENAVFACLRKDAAAGLRDRASCGRHARATEPDGEAASGAPEARAPKRIAFCDFAAAGYAMALRIRPPEEAAVFRIILADYLRQCRRYLKELAIAPDLEKQAYRIIIRRVRGAYKRGMGR